MKVYAIQIWRGNEFEYLFLFQETFVEKKKHIDFFTFLFRLLGKQIQTQIHRQVDWTMYTSRGAEEYEQRSVKTSQDSCKRGQH